MRSYAVSEKSGKYLEDPEARNERLELTSTLLSEALRLIGKGKSELSEFEKQVVAILEQQGELGKRV